MQVYNKVGEISPSLKTLCLISTMPVDVQFFFFCVGGWLFLYLLVNGCDWKS